jgi:hypothetical protein
MDRTSFQSFFTRLPQGPPPALDLRRSGRDDAGVMNKWILAAILATLAVFMYVSVILKSS